MLVAFADTTYSLTRFYVLGKIVQNGLPSLTLLLYRIFGFSIERNAYRDTVPYVRAKIKEKFLPKSTRLIDQVREVLRYHHYSIRTEKTYVQWIIKFIKFNDTRHPKEMGKDEIERFLSHLAINRNVAAATQRQAMNAVLFLY